MNPVFKQPSREDAAEPSKGPRSMAFRIGCLAWGSLVWDPRTLPRAGGFQTDGPKLPIEFSRVALDGRVTLVIDPMAREVRTHWVRLAVESLEEAVAELGMREKIAPVMWSRWVGRQLRRDPMQGMGIADPGVRRVIADWLEERALDAVVWTSLPSRGAAGGAKRPNCDQLVHHLKSLEGAARDRAEEYIRRAPESIRTAYRMQFEERLGWIPRRGGD